MTTLRSYQNIGEAGFAQSLLEAAGIPAVLEHEAAAVFAPMGVCAVRLQVPEENLAEADRILAEHPVHFSDAEDVPRFGFWRGSAIGLLLSLGVIALLNALFTPTHLSFGFSLLGWFIGGAVGANHRLETPVPDEPKA